ncbi:hypothetical protein [Vitiosangium sp. GDMCC 1.1324]|uniref:hypothetical protein n=1 Tax=Vitiosangium sp. (strain GDMCC 1.1324) TaxID=2138576 RepID=UPI001E5ED34C|nr:hypothetical protein [Vitiosangium sp. GDMCC 1.1324]
MVEDAERVLQVAMMRPGTLEFLSTPPHRPRESAPRIQSRRRIALAAGIGALVAAALLAFTHRASPGVQVVVDADAEGAGTGWGGSGNVADDVVLTSATDTEPIVLARPMPKSPFDNQKRPPCKKPVEVEAFGGCWVPHEIRAPCPDDLYEREGKCYLPAAKPKATPAAVSLQPLAVQSE